MNLFPFLDNSDAKAHERNRLATISDKLDILLAHLGDTAVSVGTSALSSAVMAHLNHGDKIGAIKVYREETGADLRTAKDVIDGTVPAEDGVSWDEMEAKIDRLILLQGIKLPDVPKSDLTAQIVHLLQRNDKIEAIKQYREAKNIGLKEAKDAVDAIEAQLHAR